MTWNDFYRRQDAIKAVLEYARQNPSETPTPQAVPEARGVFADTDELICALHYKWVQALTARVGLALDDADGEPQLDRVQAVTNAWRRAATDNPVLRGVLDRYDGEPSSNLHRSREREQRLLALAGGLTEIGEPPAETARVGSAFLRLLQVPAPESCAKRPRAFDRLRNLLPTS